MSHKLQIIIISGINIGGGGGGGPPHQILSFIQLRLSIVGQLLTINSDLSCQPSNEYQQLLKAHVFEQKMENITVFHLTIVIIKVVKIAIILNKRVMVMSITAYHYENTPMLYIAIFHCFENDNF